MRDMILSALASGPKSITDLAGGSMSYEIRAPIRAEVDLLIAAGAVRNTSIGRRRLFALASWRASDAWLIRHLCSLMVREGSHLIWPGKFDRWQRAVTQIDGERVDVRRTLYQLQRGRSLRTRESVRVRCEHEQCMSIGCMVVTTPKGRGLSVASKQKISLARRARSKWDDAIVEEVRASNLPHPQIAQQTGMALSTVGAIKSGRRWKDYSSPWAGLVP